MDTLHGSYREPGHHNGAIDVWVMAHLAQRVIAPKKERESETITNSCWHRATSMNNYANVTTYSCCDDVGYVAMSLQ